MSWQIVPMKVDWQEFLRCFPRPAKWASDTTTSLRWDDSRQQEAWAACYVALRRYLPVETILSVELLVQATTLDLLPKWKGFRRPTWYTPYCNYDAEDFQGPASGCPPIPMMSPGNVVDMLFHFRSRESGQIAVDIGVAWDRLGSKGARQECERLGFENAGHFVDYLNNWRVIMEEIEQEKAGYALDFA